MLSPSSRSPGIWTGCSPRIDAGEIELTGSGGLIRELIEAALERGLQAQLRDHLGYNKGDLEASLFANSRNNGTTAKRVLSQAGDLPFGRPARP